jgi:hypothetical protein
MRAEAAEAYDQDAGETERLISARTSRPRCRPSEERQQSRGVEPGDPVARRLDPGV